MIFKLVRRNIAANWGRLALTLLSVVLGVAFVSGSFLLADSLRAIFSQVTDQIFAGVDAEVRSVSSDLDRSGIPPRFPDTVLDEVLALDTVESALGDVGTFDQVFTVNADGQPNKPMGGAPTFAFSWEGPGPASSFTLADGRAPGPNEIAIDNMQASMTGQAVGDTATVVDVDGERHEMPIVGTVLFGDTAGTGVFFNLFELDTMQTLADAHGELDTISLSAASGVSNDELVDSVQAVLDPATFEVLSKESLIDEQNSEFGLFIDIFGYILLGFAFVVLFVSVFLIYNTFVILVSQRLRQFGLLRAVGATGKQLRQMVIIESLAIGVLASIIGLFGGIVVSWLLKQLLSSGGGGDFPDGGIVFRPRTIIVVFVVGIGVTMLSAIAPAIRASRVAPLSAISGVGLAEQSNRRRLISGLVLLIPGVLLLGYGMFGTIDGIAPRLSAIGFGGIFIFVGVALLSVLVAAPITRVIGAPIQSIKGITGRLARDNASRNPQRSAATATALMIGLALIAGVTVLQQSIKASIDAVLDDSVEADVWVFVRDQPGASYFSGTTVTDMAALDEVAAAAGTATVSVRWIDDPDAAPGDESAKPVIDVDGFDTATGTKVFDPGIVEGVGDVGESGALISEQAAQEKGLGVGDSVTFQFIDEATETFDIVGVFDNAALFPSQWIIDRSVVNDHSDEDVVNFALATYADGVDPADGQAAVAAAVSGFPQLDVQSDDEFRQSSLAQLDSVLAVIGGLLALCIVVAFIGIVNTMALSVLERTREIGLLRAVGTSRRQLRSSIRWEAVIVSSFGAVMGIALGILMGWAAVLAIPDFVASKVSVPWWLILFVVVGALLGVVAAVFPARRAANLDVLDAVTYE